jgi:hypothetical protein
MVWVSLLKNQSAFLSVIVTVLCTYMLVTLIFSTNITLLCSSYFLGAEHHNIKILNKKVKSDTPDGEITFLEY